MASDLIGLKGGASVSLLCETSRYVGCSLRCICIIYLNVFQSCSQLLIRNLRHEFLVSSILLRLHVLALSEANSHKMSFHSNNIFPSVNISASYLLIISIGGSPLFPAHLLCQLFPKSPKLSSTSICTHP
jgi:hypothetical protein